MWQSGKVVGETGGVGHDTFLFYLAKGTDSGDEEIMITV